jgi:hypothetical protein
MKRSVLILLVLFVFGFGTSSWGQQCPEDTIDLGECDTLNVVPHDTVMGSLPGFATVKLLVTHDLPNPLDSIAAFAIPLAYTHTNPSKYCSVTSYWNNTKLYPSSKRVRSIFRHLEISPGDTMFNRMMSLSELEDDLEWDTFILELDGTSHFWLSMIPLGQGQLWWEGDRVLLATMTFRVEDAMIICIDSTIWGTNQHLKYSRGGDAATYIPRHNMPICFPVKLAGVREIQGSEDSRPSEFLLSQNYPNPFNPATNFQFSLSKFVHVKIDIFNIVGQKVRTLVNEEMRPGVYIADWDGKDGNGNFVSSGIYFYRMQAGDFSDMKKMLLLK